MIEKRIRNRRIGNWFSIIAVSIWMVGICVWIGQDVNPLKAVQGVVAMFVGDLVLFYIGDQITLALNRRLDGTSTDS